MSVMQSHVPMSPELFLQCSEMSVCPYVPRTVWGYMGIHQFQNIFCDKDLQNQPVWFFLIDAFWVICIWHQSQCIWIHQVIFYFDHRCFQIENHGLFDKEAYKYFHHFDVWHCNSIHPNYKTDFLQWRWIIWFYNLCIAISNQKSIQYNLVHGCF